MSLDSLKLVPVNYVTKKAAAMPLDKVSILAPKMLVLVCLFSLRLLFSKRVILKNLP